MARVPFTYVAEGVKAGDVLAVPNATVTFYEADGTTLLAQTLWSQASGGTAQANPTTTGANGATSTFWLDTGQTIVVKWTAAGWSPVTDAISVGGGSGGGSPTGAAGGDLAGSSYPNPVVANGAITSAKLANGAATGTKLGSDVLTTTLVNAANGVTGLDANGKVGASQLYGSGLRRTFDSFGGKKSAGSPTLSSQTTAWTAARVWSDSVGGGIVEFEAGLYTHMPTLELGDHMTILGAGMYAARLQFDSTITSGSCVYNHVSTNTATDPNAYGCRVESLWIDCSQLPNWGINAVNGITWDRNPRFGSQAAADSAQPPIDANHTVRDVYIQIPPQDGCVALAMGGQHWENIYVTNAGRYGFQPPFDSAVFSCQSAFSRKEGWLITGAPAKLVACKAFSSGNDAATRANGQAFHIKDVGQSEVALIGCEAQDNWAAGVWIDNCSGPVKLVGMLVDSNSVRGVGTDPGIDVSNSPHVSIDAICVERRVDGVNSYQQNAISLRIDSNAASISLTHSGDNGGTVGAPFKAIGTGDVGAGSSASFCSINNLLGYQGLAFPGTLTPDFYAGGTIELTVLTGNLTVNAPTNTPYPKGTLARFIFKQDGTGGRTITWNATYVNTPTTNTTASAYTVGRFVFDGTNWVGI